MAEPRPGRSIVSLSDGFGRATVSPQWTWVRPPAASTYSVQYGSLVWQTQDADIHPPATPLASVLTEPAPQGDYVVETRVAVNTPASGMGQNYVQGGLVIYGDDGDYVKLASVSIWDTRQTEFGKQVTNGGTSSYGNGVVGPVGDWTSLRIVHHVVNSQDAYTAYTSIDGVRWDKGDTWTADLGAHPKIGLISMGGSGFVGTFDYVKVSRVDKR